MDRARGAGPRLPRPRRAGLAGGVLAVLLAALPGPSRPRAEIHPAARPIVERYLEATGGAAMREAEHTLHLKGRVELNGMAGRWEMWIAEPDRWVRHWTVGPLKIREGFDGTHAWRTDDAGRQVQLLSAADVRHAREEGWFLNERWTRPDQDGGTVRTGSRSYGENADFDVLVVTPPGGTPRKLYLSARTALIERIAYEEDHHEIEVRLEGYRKLGGRLRPTMMRAPTLLEGDSPSYRQTLDSVRVNVPMDSARFAPPQLAGRKIAWGRPPGVVRMPMSYARRTVVVKASINGAAPADFILDTGASTTCIDKDYAFQIGLAAEGRATAEGVSATADMEFARARTISVAGRRGQSASLSDFRVAILDFGRSDEYVLWTQTAGLLGADFLSHFVVEIDYDSLAVTLRDPAGHVYRRGGAAIPFELTSGIPVVDVRLEDGCAGKFLVDVGNAFGLTISGSLVRGCDLLRTKQRRNVEVEGGGIGGGFISSLCRLDSIRVGPFAWPDPVAALALTRSGILGSKDIGGLIGNSTLERFHCTFDYADRTLYLEPGRRHAARERTSRFGAMLVRVGPDVYAGGVLLGSAAQAAGLRWYDKILAIDDRPLERWTREEVDRLLDNGEIGAVHTVTYQRLEEPQRTVEVKLKDVL